jgi:cytochrome c-type biogenesis protein CcmH/NrfF
MTADRTKISWFMLVIVFASLLAFGTLDSGGPSTNGERVTAIAETIKCPQCTSESVAQSSVPIARVILSDIARRVDAGESDEEIRQVLADRYGPEVLLTPSSSGLAGLVWVIPVVGFGAAALVLAYSLLRSNRQAMTAATDADRDLVADALSKSAEEPRG